MIKVRHPPSTTKPTQGSAFLGLSMLRKKEAARPRRPRRFVFFFFMSEKRFCSFGQEQRAGWPFGKVAYGCYPITQQGSYALPRPEASAKSPPSGPAGLGSR